MSGEGGGGGEGEEESEAAATLRSAMCEFCTRKRFDFGCEVRVRQGDHPHINAAKKESDGNQSPTTTTNNHHHHHHSCCPACLNCFRVLSRALSMEEEEEEDGSEDVDGEADDATQTTTAAKGGGGGGEGGGGGGGGKEVHTADEFAKYCCRIDDGVENNGKGRRRRRVRNGETVTIDVAFPPSLAMRQAIAKEILLRGERRKKRKEEEEKEDVDEDDELDTNGDFGMNATSEKTTKTKSRHNGSTNQPVLDDVVQPARDALMEAVRLETGCDKVQLVRDKAKASVMVYVEYEGVPLAARGINTNTNENNENNDEAMTMVSEDFKAMRHFKVKRPNDRQKNWKKRKRREGRKPHWELVLSQPEPKYLAAFEDARLEYSRVYKETLTDGFLQAIGTATTETLMSALYNNTYKAVVMKQKREKKKNPISARVRVWAAPVYVAGRYAKFARDVPQSPWSNCPVKWARATESVQDALEDAILKAANADGAKFNSSGREDLDVRMLGEGRPFVLEVHNPKSSASELRENLVRAETLMNQSSFLKTDVKAFNLRVVPKETYKNVGLRLDSNEKEKSYSCICICDPPVPTGSSICDVVSAMKDVELKQQTPIRVSHRRSDLVRSRTLREIKVSVIPGTRGRCVYVDLRAESGTYIKEFCHGDDGRTKPSLGDLLGNGTKCDIIQLDVTKVDAVGFE